MRIPKFSNEPPTPIKNEDVWGVFYIIAGAFIALFFVTMCSPDRQGDFRIEDPQPFEWAEILEEDRCAWAE